MKLIEGRIEEIKGDKIHGASFLAKKSLETLKVASEQSQSGETGGFLNYLENVAEKLTRARPSMSPIANVVAQFSDRVKMVSGEEDVISLKKFAVSMAEKLFEELNTASLKTAQNASLLIQNEDKVMTCSHSSSVVNTLKTAKSQGKSFEVLACESRSEDISYGEKIAQELKSFVSVKVIPDDKIEDCIEEVSMVLVGADSILKDGSLINGTPTYRLALAANGKIPFYVVCERIKFSTSDKEAEKGFDYIPASLITRIVTD
jgi:translation initiation factor eIF-2B subunit delta